MPSTSVSLKEFSPTLTCYPDVEAFAYEQIELYVICNVYNESPLYYVSDPTFLTCLYGKFDTSVVTPRCWSAATFLYSGGTSDTQVIPPVGMTATDLWLSEACYYRFYEVRSPTSSPVSQFAPQGPGPTSPPVSQFVPRGPDPTPKSYSKSQLRLSMIRITLGIVMFVGSLILLCCSCFSCWKKCRAKADQPTADPSPVTLDKRSGL
jgi:hypothetical protein